MMALVHPHHKHAQKVSHLETEVSYGKCLPYHEIPRMFLMQCVGEVDNQPESKCHPAKYLDPINEL